MIIKTIIIGIAVFFLTNCTVFKNNTPDTITIPKGYAAVQGSYTCEPFGFGELCNYIIINEIDQIKIDKDPLNMFNDFKKDATQWHPVKAGKHLFRLIAFSDPQLSFNDFIEFTTKPNERYSFSKKALYSESHFLSWRGGIEETIITDSKKDIVFRKPNIKCWGAFGFVNPESPEILACQRALWAKLDTFKK